MNTYYFYTLHEHRECSFIPTPFDIKGGEDVRKIHRYGLKETTEEGYYYILKDDARIVKDNFDDKTIFLLNEFNTPVNGWHFPIKLQAENREELKIMVRKLYPFFAKFYFLDEKS
jgi:hypothetical protein